MNDNERVILDSENYREGNEGVSFKEIVLSQVKRVVTNMSQEMREGFWLYNQANPNISPTKARYVGDSRKELRSSLDCLHDLLLPKFDEEMKKQSELIYKEYEELYEKWKNKELDGNIDNYWSTALKIYRKLFQQLCLFLERLGWLESSEIEE